MATKPTQDDADAVVAALTDGQRWFYAAHFGVTEHHPNAKHLLALAGADDTFTAGMARARSAAGRWLDQPFPADRMELLSSTGWGAAPPLQRWDLGPGLHLAISQDGVGDLDIWSCERTSEIAVLNRRLLSIATAGVKPDKVRLVRPSYLPEAVAVPVLVLGNAGVPHAMVMGVTLGAEPRRRLRQLVFGPGAATADVGDVAEVHDVAEVINLPVRTNQEEPVEAVPEPPPPPATTDGLGTVMVTDAGGRLWLLDGARFSDGFVTGTEAGRTVWVPLATVRSIAGILDAEAPAASPSPGYTNPFARPLEEDPF
jgi:hypothetical protein